MQRETCSICSMPIATPEDCEQVTWGSGEPKFRGRLFGRVFCSCPCYRPLEPAALARTFTAAPAGSTRRVA